MFVNFQRTHAYCSARTPNWKGFSPYKTPRFSMKRRVPMPGNPLIIPPDVYFFVAVALINGVSRDIRVLLRKKMIISNTAQFE